MSLLNRSICTICYIIRYSMLWISCFSHTGYNPDTNTVQSTNGTNVTEGYCRGLLQCQKPTSLLWQLLWPDYETECWTVPSSAENERSRWMHESDTSRTLQVPGTDTDKHTETTLWPCTMYIVQWNASLIYNVANIVLHENVALKYFMFKLSDSYIPLALVPSVFVYQSTLHSQ